MYKEKDIVIEGEGFWILKDKKKNAYHVMKIKSTHSESIASFELTDDGLSLAMAYYRYQENRIKEKG